jgi:hypothetical protein
MQTPLRCCFTYIGLIYVYNMYIFDVQRLLIFFLKLDKGRQFVFNNEINGFKAFA